MLLPLSNDRNTQNLGGKPMNSSEILSFDGDIIFVTVSYLKYRKF